MNPVYCKYSNDRAEEFQIKTAIFLDKDGKKTVRKIALTVKAENHIDQIYEHYLQMEESFNTTRFVPNLCRKVNNSVELEFVEGKTFEQYLDDLYVQGRYLEIIEEIKEYKDLLYSLSDNIPFYYTEAFDTVFGKHTHFTGCKSLKVSNIDFIFGNIVIGSKWTVIDYEWVFDFPVPIEFIIYRAVHYYLYSSTKRSALLGFQIFTLLGISAEEMDMYAEMERNFQRYVAGNRDTMAELKKEMLKDCINVHKVVPNHRADFVQIYMDRGEGFNENDSFIRQYDHADGKVEIEFDVLAGTKRLRIDPAVSVAVIKDISVWGDGKRLALEKTNALFLDTGTYIFGKEDPQIFVPDIQNSEKIRVDFSVAALSEGWSRDTVALFKAYTALEEEKQNLLLLNEGLTIEKNKAEQYINQLRNRFAWRMYTKIKKFFGRN